MAHAALRRVASLTSWFNIPEQGMKQFEVLSQASTVVSARATGDVPIALAWAPP